MTNETNVFTTRGPLAFPPQLFGDSRTVTRSWKRITKVAWKTGNWEEAFEDIPFVDAPSLGSQFVVGTAADFPRSSETTWRLYEVERSLRAILISSTESERPNRMDRFDSLVLPAMRRWLWFTMGLMHCDAGCFYFPTLERSKSSAELCQAYLQCFTDWLPELESYNEFVYHGVTSISSNPGFRLAWARIILVLANDCGWNIPSWEERQGYEGQLSDLLMQIGCIERDGNRFQLMASPK